MKPNKNKNLRSLRSLGRANSARPFCGRYSHVHSPERVIVYSRDDGEIGNELAFKLPSNGFKIFKKNPIVKSLILRVENARKT